MHLSPEKKELNCGYTFAEVTTADHSAVLAFHAELSLSRLGLEALAYRFETNADTQERFVSYVNSQELTLFMVTSRTNEIVGLADAYIDTDKKKTIIFSFIVNPQYQRNGIGTQLLLGVMQHYKQKGFEYLEAEVVANNRVSVAFFDKKVSQLQGLKKRQDGLGTVLYRFRLR